MARSASGTADFAPLRNSDRSGWLRATWLKPAFERGLVSRQTELTLQQECGHATLVSSHQVGRPEPAGQRSLGPMENGSGRQRNLVSALGALLASLVHQFVGSPVPASRTDQAIRPPTSGQVLLAGLLRSEVGLKLAERFGERRSWHPSTLPVGAC
jgi:hypothetical protein